VRTEALVRVSCWHDRSVSEDRRRALADYEQMADLYADDAAVDPLKVSYDRSTILAMAGNLRGKRVLDVGCASGGLSEGFVERGASVVGMDLNPRLIERARGRLGSRAEFHVADISAPLAFESGWFDIVAASLVLHHLKDWEPPLREFARVLRPGGLLVLPAHHPTQDVMIATPPAPYFETVLLTDTWRKGGQEFQVRFSHRPISAIVDALADAGFVIERMPEPVPDPKAFPDRVFYERMLSADRGSCSSAPSLVPAAGTRRASDASTNGQRSLACLTAR
jgi:ubiquinone/menaquinone biosynthesis C-methylase UbiE